MDMTTIEEPPQKRTPSPTNPKSQYLSLIEDFCTNLKYNGRMIIKHLFDNSLCSAFRVNWYEEIPNKTAPMIITEKIVHSHFILLNLDTMEIKIQN